MEIARSFEIMHPMEVVWPALTDLEFVADSLPGAVLTEVGVNGVHSGQMIVSLGGIRASFQGTAELVAVDSEAKSVSLRAEGGGEYGRVVMRLTYALRESENRKRTEVSVMSSVELFGRVAQLGSSIASSVTDRLISQMIDSFDKRLAGDYDAPATAMHIRLTPREALAPLVHSPIMRLSATCVAGCFTGLLVERLWHLTTKGNRQTARIPRGRRVVIIDDR